MLLNSPTHEVMDKDSDSENEEEVYEIEDVDDLDLLEEQLANDDSSMADNDEELEEGEDIYHSGIIFAEHKGSVFNVAFSSQDNIVASGGEDDLAYIWDAETGSTLFTCTGHKDSVTNVTFSHDGSYLATADMSGFIQVWKVSTKLKVWEFETDDINWLIWHTSSNVLFAGTCTGEVWMWLIPNGHTKSLSHAGTSSECAALMRDGKRLCVGYGDGTIKVLDLKGGIALQTFKSHSREITTLCGHTDNILILSGSLDGNAVISNTLSGKTIASFNCTKAKEVDEEVKEEIIDSVEVVSFCPTIPNLAVTGSLSGLITIWDISNQTIRHHIEQEYGTTTIKWHTTSPYFFTAGVDGKLRMYDVRSAELIGKFVGHSNTILNCDISITGNKAITGSDDGSARIYKLEIT